MFPNFRGEHKKIFEFPPSFSLSIDVLWYEYMGWCCWGPYSNTTSDGRVASWRDRWRSQFYPIATISVHPKHIRKYRADSCIDTINCEHLQQAHKPSFIHLNICLMTSHATIPKQSMYCIFTYIWLKFIINVGKYHTWIVWDYIYLLLAICMVWCRHCSSWPAPPKRQLWQMQFHCKLCNLHWRWRMGLGLYKSG